VQQHRALAALSHWFSIERRAGFVLICLFSEKLLAAHSVEL
jgi:hypothetical protein